MTTIQKIVAHKIGKGFFLWHDDFEKMYYARKYLLEQNIHTPQIIGEGKTAEEACEDLLNKLNNL